MKTRDDILKQAREENVDEYIDSLYFKVCRNSLIAIALVLFLIYWYFAYPSHQTTVTIFGKEVFLSSILFIPLEIGMIAFFLSAAKYFRKKIFLFLGVFILILLIYGVIV